MPISLKNVPLFQGLTESELDSIKDCLHEKSFAKGESLLAEGQACGRIFIVRLGRVKLYRNSGSGREQILEILGPGDTCACNPGTREWHCASSAEAETPCTVWFLSIDNYIRMLQTHNQLAHTLNKLFAERLRCFSSLIEEISLKDTQKRLVKFILDMTVEKKEEKVLFLPLTQEEIAQRIGTTRETVARHLSGLKQLKLIDLKPYQIIIRDKEGLKRLL